MLRRVLIYSMPGAHAGPAVCAPLVARVRARDMIDGGAHRIHGIARVASQPAARQVLLLDNASLRVVRGTWSDAQTGAYQFNWLRPGDYIAVERDYAKQYFPDVKDHVKTEPMT